ncbi:MAG: glycosyltransferase [Patescibacteria group bacterium]
MNISICITVLNEESSIGKLLGSLINQSLKANEIIIVDGGSTDKTIEIINHYQKKDRRIRLLKEKCFRARGRNLGIEIAKNEIIAMTDAGCVPKIDWLEKLIQPFKSHSGSGIDVVAGFYKMVGETKLQKAMSVFLGTKPSNFDNNFLPSTRSMAFRKNVWEEIGGFPEENGNSAEDTYFNYNAIKFGVKYARVKSAIVEWGMPDSIFNFYFSIFNYAKWDGQTKVWFFPGKGFTSHNIKAVFVIFRYLIGLLLLIFSFESPYLFTLFLICLFVYLIFAYKKAGLWGIPLQFVTDFSVMNGFISGIIN